MSKSNNGAISNNKIKRTKLIMRLFVGLFLYAVGEVLTINANIGLGPWDVLHQGLAKTFDISIGQATMLISIVVVMVNRLLGEKVGFGTLANMLFIGLFMDLLIKSKLLPCANSMLVGIGMIILGMVVLGIASYVYLGVGMGAGPRDGLMIILTKCTNKSVHLIRTTIEGTAMIAGFILGGSIGIGTVIFASLIGVFIQSAFKIFKFDVKKVQHKLIS